MQKEDKVELAISELTVRLLFLFFPGIVCTILINKLTERKEESIVYFFIRAFIYGLLSYFLLYICNFVFNNLIKLVINLICIQGAVPKQFNVMFLQCLFDSNVEFNIYEIFFATISSVLIAMVTIFVENKNLINKFAEKIGISNKFGEIDVWSYVFTSIDSNTWVIIRDYDKSLVYEGWPSAFSSNYKENELFLENVTVYNIDCEELYKTEAMYITTTSDNMIIEFRKVISEKESEEIG